eukprot:TRINITY_DN14636_c0_g1_i1.p1 TRINITY_DN14636_c0_g1~~TRINITY_DN14636_c0_g1_i1.p1  ORF type:complete len:314 (+),score=65.49 TRINITY_DN14636_c0_g1_i1:99-1040(+)
MVSVVPTSATISPLVVTSILDHYSRREEMHTAVFGALLGSAVGSSVDIRLAVPVPHSESHEEGGNLAVHLKAEGCHSLYMQTTRRDSVIGWYSTNHLWSSLHEKFLEQFYPRKPRRSGPGQETTRDPARTAYHLVFLVVDPTTASTTGSISVSPFSMVEPLPSLPPMTRQMPFTYALGDVERTVIGALASSVCPNLVARASRLAPIADSRYCPVDSVQMPDATPVGVLNSTLDGVFEYVSDAAEGKIHGDPAIARGLLAALAELPPADETLDEAFEDAVETLLAVQFTGKLLQTHALLADQYHRDRSAPGDRD